MVSNQDQLTDVLQLESNKLAAAWNRHDAAMLNDYLVSDEEDPRINLQSILMRHHLINTLFPSRYTELFQNEILFGICMTNLVLLIKAGHSRMTIIEELDHPGTTSCQLPQWLRDIYDRQDDDLSDYLTYALCDPIDDSHSLLPESSLSTFQSIWQGQLKDETAQSLSVMELACGSANDYRFIHDYGIARLVDYTGLDICSKNISNALTLFPHTPFKVGNALAIDAPDKSVDILIVQDLFEHLSEEAFTVALAEITRVTRHTACLGFFNLAPIEDHIIRPSGPYYWNTLSQTKIIEMLTANNTQIQAIHIDRLAKSSIPTVAYHNKKAYILFATFH